MKEGSMSLVVKHGSTAILAVTEPYFTTVHWTFCSATQLLLWSVHTSESLMHVSG